MSTVSTVSTGSTVSTVSTVIALCYLHLRWYFLLLIDRRFAVFGQCLLFLLRIADLTACPVLFTFFANGNTKHCLWTTFLALSFCKFSRQSPFLDGPLFSKLFVQWFNRCSNHDSQPAFFAFLFANCRRAYRLWNERNIREKIVYWAELGTFSNFAAERVMNTK